MTDQHQELGGKHTDDFKFTKGTLKFFRSQLDDFTLECFRLVARHHNKGGLIKTKKLDDYFENRAKYDRAFLTLEAQGFIENKPFGNMRPYLVTIRGFQLVELLKEEKELATKHT